MTRRQRQPQEAMILDANPGEYSELTRLLAQRRNNPVYSVGQGIAQAGGDIATAFLEKKYEDEQKAAQQAQYRDLAEALSTATQSGNVGDGPPMSPQMAARSAYERLSATRPDLAVNNMGAFMDIAQQFAPPDVPQPWQMQEGPRGAKIAVNPMTGEPKQIVGPDNGATFEQQIQLEALRQQGRATMPRPPPNMRAVPGSDPQAPEYEPIPGSKLALETADKERKTASARAGDKAAVRGITQSADKTITAIDDLLMDKGLDAIIGPVDARTPNIFPAANRAQAKLNNIKSRGFLDTLEAMRTTSATGSTGMGALSEKEGAIIQNAIAALDQTTTKDEFRRQLKIVRDTMAQSKNNVRLKYRDEYGDDFNPYEEQGIDGQKAAAGVPDAEIDAILNKYGVQ